MIASEGGKGKTRKEEDGVRTGRKQGDEEDINGRRGKEGTRKEKEEEEDINRKEEKE